jgi:hypothetical protein
MKTAILVFALLVAASNTAIANTVSDIDASSGGGLGAVGPATMGPPSPAEICFWACGGSGVAVVLEYGLAQQVTFSVSFNSNQPINIEFSTNSTARTDYVSFDIAIANNTNSIWNSFFITVNSASGSTASPIEYESAAGSIHGNQAGFLTVTQWDDGFQWWGNCPSQECPSRTSGVGTEIFAFILGLDAGGNYNFTLQLTPNGDPPLQPISGTPLPATLPLFATGLGAMGLLGWRRKRRNAAALAAT